MRDVVYLRRPLQDVVHVDKIVTIYYFTYDKTYCSHGESHDFWEINYVDRGTIIVTCDGTEHVLSQGDLIVLPPDRHHSLRADGQGPSSVFILSFEAKSAMLEKLGGGVFAMRGALKEQLNAVIRLCGETYVLPMPRVQVQCLEVRADAPIGSQQMLRTSLEQLLIQMLQRAFSPEEADSRRTFASKSQFDDCIAQQIMAMLHEGVYSRLSLEDITRRIGYGKTYLCSIFKKVYSTSIMSCFMRLKIEEAQHLLHEGTLTISEISDRLGFSSPQYFSKCFAQATGMSPRVFSDSVDRTWSSVIRS